MIETILSGILGVLITGGMGAVVTLKVKGWLIEQRMTRNPLVYVGARLSLVRNKSTGSDYLIDCEIVSLEGKSIELEDQHGHRVWLTNVQFDGYEIIGLGDS